MPSPGAPSRSAGVASNARSAVEEEFSPIFSSSRVTAKPGAPARTTNAPMPVSARAKTMNVAACDPLVIHCFVPVSRPSESARVRSAAASEPEPDSVSANAPSSSPAASAGTWRSPPWASSGSVQALVWTATVTPTPASARESSSSTST